MASLSEVARSGRKFRRLKEPKRWLWIIDGQFKTDGINALGGAPMTMTIQISAEEVIAADWESEPKRIEVTAEDLREAAKLVSNERIVHQRRFSPVEMMNLVIPLLGLD